MFIIEKYLKQEDYENNDKEYLYYIFIKEIAKLSGEGELLLHHEFSINYDEKFCIFSDFYIDYETQEKIYEDYKIILKPKKDLIKALKSNLLFNIFIFNH